MSNIRLSHLAHFKTIPYKQIDNFRDFYYEEKTNDTYFLDWDHILKYHKATGYDGIERKMHVRRHAFNINGYAQRYVRVGNIMRYPDIKFGYVLDAPCYLIDAAKLWELGHKRMMEDAYYFVDKM